jgi:hypothetical protein
MKNPLYRFKSFFFSLKFGENLPVKIIAHTLFILDSLGFFLSGQISPKSEILIKKCENEVIFFLGVFNGQNF